MKKLNEKILHALKSGKETEKIFRMLLKAQENLLKNHSNPVFNKADTNKILKAHTSLDDVGKSLYRYNTLQEHHLESQAREEWQTLLHDILGLINPIGTFLNTIKIFISNYLELLYHAYHLKEFEMDKYYHSKANCEATQTMGIIGQKSAEILSDLKEQYDKYTYVRTHKVSLEEAIADSERDQVANRLGRERGRQYPYCNCAILMHD